jgi:hypothetical protein
MNTRETRYSLENAKQDIRLFFNDDDHWAYQYGSTATNCNKNSVFYKKQLQVIFEDKYPHDITGKAINELISDGFLRENPVAFGDNMHTIFVYNRRNIRYIAMAVKEKIKIMEKFSDDEVNDGAGKYAEYLFLHMFNKYQFNIIGRHTNSIKNKIWTESDRNLDFIIQKEGISYGVEVKNRFDYMEQNEFEEKLEICQYLGLLPMFPIRCPSDQQYAQMQMCNGLALKFKTRIFPPGFQNLVTDIWNNFRLPVNIWEEIKTPIVNIFLHYHYKNVNQE